MLDKLLKRKESKENEFVPWALQNLSDVQQKNYERFRGDLGEFYLGKSEKAPNELYIGISDGYLGHMDIGKITVDGEVHLIFPDIDSLSKGSLSEEIFMEILDGTLNLKKALENKGINYNKSVNKDKYSEKIRDYFNSKTSGLVSRI